MRWAVFLFAVVLFVSLIHCARAADFSVGVSPPVVEVGDVQQGDQKIIKFSIFTVSTDPLLVYFDVQSGTMDFFNRGYSQYMSNFSEEPTDKWVDLVQNPVEIDTTQAKIVGRSWKDITVILNVPKDAEPGYHVVQLLPKPTVYGKDNAPVGTNIVAVTQVSLIFNVVGNPQRQGVILDAIGSNFNDRGFTLKTPFKNTGTDTLYTRVTSTILDKNGTAVGTFDSSREYVQPGAVTQFETPVIAQLSAGEYSVHSVAHFTTGDAVNDAMIKLQQAVAAQQEQPQGEIPWILIIGALAVVFIFFAVYRWHNG